MKKIIIVLVLSIFVIFSVSCSEKSVEEKMLEKMIETAGEIDADITNDGENIDISSEDGDYEVGSNLSWPENSMGGIPELKGNILYVEVDEETGSGTIALAEVKGQDAEDFLNKLLESGYEGEKYSGEEGIVFEAQNQQGDFVDFSYDKNTKESMITFESNQSTVTDKLQTQTPVEKSVDKKELEEMLETATKIDVDNLDNIEDIQIPTEDEDLEDEDYEIDSNLSWPVKSMGDIPELKGNIIDVYEQEGYCTISLSEVGEQDAEDFLNKLLESGYEGEKYSGEEEITFEAQNQQGNVINYIFYKTAKESVISYTHNQSNTTEQVDMTDTIAWPAESMGNIPELNGKIVDIVYSDAPRWICIYVNYVTIEDAKAYVQDIKNAGYNIDVTVNPTMEGGMYEYFYEAFNIDGKKINYCYNIFDRGCEVRIELFEKTNK